LNWNLKGGVAVLAVDSLLVLIFILTLARLLSDLREGDKSQNHDVALRLIDEHHQEEKPSQATARSKNRPNRETHSG
jgi:hypothetical protein